MIDDMRNQFFSYRFFISVYCLSTIYEDNRFSYGKIGPIYGFIQTVEVEHCVMQNII
jgi:hypothetical protein